MKCICSTKSYKIVFNYYLNYKVYKHKDKCTPQTFQNFEEKFLKYYIIKIKN